MYISRVYIENYRSIEKIDLSFKKGKNVLIGKNNSGKSNIIKAIDLVMGENSPTYSKSDNVSENDFYLSNTEQEIFIFIEICKDGDNLDSISDDNFARINYQSKEYRINISDISNNDQKEKIFEFSYDYGQNKLDDSNSGFRKYWVGNKTYCKKTTQNELKDMNDFAICFRCEKNGDLFDKKLVFLYREDSSKDWIVTINANLRNGILQSAIIPSFRDPKNQLSTSSYSWYGKLLKKYTNIDNDKLKKAFAEVSSASDDVFKDLQKNICDNSINIAFPDAKISFKLNPETKPDVLKNTLIYVNDGFNSDIKEKGAGIQSAVIISLFDFYVRNISKGGSLLIVEEPEVYLHAHGRRALSDRLNNFTKDNNNQLIITTHSSEFISNIHENYNLISVKKDGYKTIAKNIEFNTAKRKQILIKKQNSEMFFADAVILVEGADKYILEELSKTYAKKNNIDENWLNTFNISIINCGGKHELWKYVDVLNELCILNFTLADYDFFNEGLGNMLSKLGFETSLIDELNAIKSTNFTRVKDIDKILISLKKTDISSFINKMKDRNIFILSGELEKFYKIKPSSDKEQGVIETISDSIEHDKSIEEYININEFYEFYDIFRTKFSPTTTITNNKVTDNNSIDDIIKEDFGDDIPF